MSGRTVSTCTLAVALLLGAVGGGRAQENQFQTPINNGAPSVPSEGSAHQTPGVFTQSSEPAFGRRAEHRPKSEMSRVTTGGLGSYCAPVLPRIVASGATLRSAETEGVLAPCSSDTGVTNAPVPTMALPTPPGPVTAARAPRIEVPTLGPLGLATDLNFPVTKGPYDHKQVSNFTVGLFGKQRDEVPAPSCGMTGGCVAFRLNAPAYLITPVPAAPAVPDIPFPPLPPSALACAPVPGTIRLASAEAVLVAQPMCPPKTDSHGLLGTWYRELPVVGLQVVATFTPDELKLCATQIADGRTATLAITAHYTVTPDGLVFGTVTSADVDIKGDAKAGDLPFGADLVELSEMVQALVDVPFSCRTKMTSAGLMVSGMKCGLSMGRNETEQFQVAFGGLFKSAKDGKVPAPVGIKTKVTKADEPRPVAGALIGGVVGAPVPSIPPAASFERVGVDFNSPPVVPPATCLPPPVRPVGVSEDGTKQLAQDAFGQLLQQSGVVRPVGGMTLPSGRYLEHFPQYFPPDPVVFPLPRELASQEAARDLPGSASAVALPAAGPAKAGPVGTWFREVAGKQCVVKIDPTHLTLTVHDAQEVDGKVSTASLVITADYHLTRDGLTAVGLITSVDVSFEGDFPAEDSKPFFEMLGELQKVLEDKPLALTFRTYGEGLVIGNVRMPQVSDKMDVQPAGYMAGRYKAAGDKLPKPKPNKVTEPRAVTDNGSLPSGPPKLILPPGSAYPERAPLLPPPPLPSSNGDLLPPQQIPSAPPAPVVPSGGTDAWTSPMVPPTKPVPQMPQPVPPGEVLSAVKSKRIIATDFAVGWQSRIASQPDPAKNGRMSPGIAGQMFLFGGPKLEFAEADGVLTVDLVDDTPRPAGQAPATPERWQFDKNTLRNLQTRDETFGKSYALFLPWPAYKSDVTRVKISARYDPERGPTLFATPSTITLDNTPLGAPALSDAAKDKASAPQMPPPVPPGKALPANAPDQTGKSNTKATSATDPNIQMQQFLYLYQSAEVTQIRNEWRRFWFNDLPSKLSPERIHGGIY